MGHCFSTYILTCHIVLSMDHIRTTQSLNIERLSSVRIENTASNGQSDTTVEQTLSDDYGWYSTVTILALWFNYGMLSICGCFFNKSAQVSPLLSYKDFLTIGFVFSNVALLTCMLIPTNMVSSEGNESAFLSNAMGGFLVGYAFATILFTIIAYVNRKTPDKPKVQRRQNSQKNQKDRSSIIHMELLFIAIVISFGFGGVAILFGTNMDDENASSWFISLLIVMALKVFVLLPTVHFAAEHCCQTVEKANKQPTQSSSSKELKEEIQIEVRKSILEAKNQSSMDLKKSSSQGSQDAVSQTSPPPAPEPSKVVLPLTPNLDNTQKGPHELELVNANKTPSKESTGSRFYHDAVERNSLVQSISQYDFSGAKPPLDVVAEVEQRPNKGVEFKMTTAKEYSGYEYPGMTVLTVPKQSESVQKAVSEPKAQVRGKEVKKTPSQLSTGSDYLKHLVEDGGVVPVRSISQYESLVDKAPKEPSTRAPPQPANLIEVKRSPSQLSTGSEYFHQLMLGGKTTTVRSISQYALPKQRPK